MCPVVVACSCACTWVAQAAEVLLALSPDAPGAVQRILRHATRRGRELMLEQFARELAPDEWAHLLGARPDPG